MLYKHNKYQNINIAQYDIRQIWDLSLLKLNMTNCKIHQFCKVIIIYRVEERKLKEESVKVLGIDQEVFFQTRLT